MNHWVESRSTASTPRSRSRSPTVRVAAASSRQRRGRVGREQVRHAGDERRDGYGTHSTTAFPVAITVP